MKFLLDEDFSRSSNPRIQIPLPLPLRPLRVSLATLAPWRFIPNKSRREGTTVDSIFSIALSSQVTALKTRDTFEHRAARGNVEELAEILANVSDAPPSPGDDRD
jgi:hypothetical protein